MVAGVAAFIEIFVVIFAWGLYGAMGLAIAMLAMNVILLVAIWSLQSQVDAIDFALRGVKDDSDYSDQVRAGLGRLRGIK